MRTKRWNGALAAAALTCLALAMAPVAGADHPGHTVTIKTTVAISKTGTGGRVKSPNHACVEQRTVVLKEKGNGAVGTTRTEPTGKWSLDPAKLHLKGVAPYLLYAQVPVRKEGTAGAIYKCTAAVSGVRKISGD